MESYLPVVKEEISGSVARNLNPKQSDWQNIKREWLKIKKENPVVASFIKKFSKLNKEWEAVAYCSIIVYQMLRSQAEADFMNEHF